MDYLLKQFLSLRLLHFTLIKKKSVQPAGTNSNRVTGIYIHDTDNVRTWKFIDQRKHISIIHATPNHPFYVKNLKKFLPLQKITPAMTLIDDHHHIIHLLCPAQKNGQCGLPYHPDRISTVYNIEVNRQHQYFVSGEHILVHNCNSSPEYRYSLSPENQPIKMNKAIPSAEPDQSNYLVVGCGTVAAKNKECIHPTVHTLDINPERRPTYTDWRNIPYGQYDKVLMEYVPFVEHVMREEISPQMKSGSKIYILSEAAADEAIYFMHDMGDFKYSRILEPEDGKIILEKFERTQSNTLAGKDFFSVEPIELKESIAEHRGNASPEIKRILLEYIKS